MHTHTDTCRDTHRDIHTSTHHTCTHIPSTDMKYTHTHAHTHRDMCRNRDTHTHTSHACTHTYPPQTWHTQTRMHTHTYTPQTRYTSRLLDMPRRHRTGKALSRARGSAMAVRARSVSVTCCDPRLSSHCWSSHSCHLLIPGVLGPVLESHSVPFTVWPGKLRQHCSMRPTAVVAAFNLGL